MLVIVAAVAAHAQQRVNLQPGQTITKSITLYENARIHMPPGPPSTCLTVKGDNITVDFSDAYVRGDKDVYHNREVFNGVGLLIDGCKNVTIRNAHIQGFRFNIKVVNSENVRLINCDTSFSRSIRMSRDGQLLDTFLNLRDNNAWRTYGAGIWLENSRNCTVDRCYSTGAQNGAVLVNSDQNTITNCDFSFNGGWGVALSHSNENTISWNHADFVNRVWGGGWGGDSAAIAVANDSDRNYFVGNSLTHGGDGFFLSNLNDIGQVNPTTGFFEPMGGSDHNVIAYNDGSWSPNNAFEGTFSDGNIYIGNISNSSGFGYWLGFSTNSLILENIIADNERGGIAIEHGKGNRIEGNKLERNGGYGINLWQNGEKARSPFPSSGNDVVRNTITDSAKGILLQGSTDTVVRDNTLVRSGTMAASSDRKVTNAAAEFRSTPNWTKIQEIIASEPKDFKMYSEQRLPKGAQWLQPGEYAPKDFRGNLAAQRTTPDGIIELFLLKTGVKVKAPSWATYEDTPDNPLLVRVGANPSENGVGGDRPITIMLTGKDGKETQKVTGILRTAVWNVKWYLWDSSLGYDDANGWMSLFSREPVKTEQTRTLGGDWGSKPPEGIRNHHFALLATTKIQVIPGKYIFRSVSDDGIRVYVDDRLLINRWNHHGPTPDNVSITLDESVHLIRVEYCQEDGAATLRLDWSPN